MSETHEAMLFALKEVNRLVLVIESAVRSDQPRHHSAVLSMIKAVRGAIHLAEPRP